MHFNRAASVGLLWVLISIEKLNSIYPKSMPLSFNSENFSAYFWRFWFVPLQKLHTLLILKNFLLTWYWSQYNKFCKNLQWNYIFLLLRFFFFFTNFHWQFSELNGTFLGASITINESFQILKLRLGESSVTGTILWQKTSAQFLL